MVARQGKKKKYLQLLVFVAGLDQQAAYISCIKANLRALSSTALKPISGNTYRLKLCLK